MDKVTKAIKCSECKKVLETPVLLPCHHSICKKHAIGAKLKCAECGVEHEIPPNGFLVNEALREIIEAKIGSINFGRVHREAVDSCNQLSRCIRNLENLLNCPSVYIYDEISRLKNKVNLKSEELKLKIDEETEKLLNKLNEYQSRCQHSLTSELHSIQRNRYELSKDMGTTSLIWLKNDLNEIKFDEIKWEIIKRMSKEKIAELQESIRAFKEDLLLKEFDSYKSQVDFFERISIDFLFASYPDKSTNVNTIINKMEPSPCKIEPLQLPRIQSLSIDAITSTNQPLLSSQSNATSSTGLSSNNPFSSLKFTFNPFTIMNNNSPATKETKDNSSKSSHLLNKHKR